MKLHTLQHNYTALKTTGRDHQNATIFAHTLLFTALQLKIKPL